MNLSTCIIHYTKSDSLITYMTPKLMKELNLENNKKKRIEIGKKSVTMLIRRVKKTGKHIYFPSKMRQTINLPNLKKITILNTSKELKVGPIIGVITKERKPLSSGSSKYLYNILSSGNSNGICYLFHAKDINWNNNTIRGYTLNSNKRAYQRSMPFPDVIYNRILSRKLENHASIKEIKKKFLYKNIPIFNWDFLDKWDVYRMLEEESTVQSYLPETIIKPTSNEIKELLNRHKTVYLKPTKGCFGIGIYRISKIKNMYYLQFRKKNVNVLYRFSKFNRMVSLINRRGGYKNYLAQQGIELLEIKKSPIDFRFHLTKNKDGDWVVGGIGAKRAGKGSVTTHLNSGGELLTPQNVLANTTAIKDTNNFMDKAKETTIKIAEAIDRNYSYFLGEIGFDIGIDKNHKVWMFEANAKPGRTIFKHPQLKKQGSTVIHNLIDYCHFLSGFTSSGGID
ncbi:YheC/YheD family endospore coat-associated protein [Longirhabdus pacifica]|uniref:YheC/YheD family endospore coat-associated protein n=1 Tax=Longirhabdus pacifica TaxID=2305227 RepID=UPI001008D54A|nr:YheC/YheD family protein [Longirhabdus pacifica]